MRLYEVLEVCVVLANNIKHVPDSEEQLVSPPKIFYSAAPWSKKMPCAQPGIKDNLHLQGKFWNVEKVIKAQKN